MTPEEILKTKAPVTPELALIWTAVVDIGPREDWGMTPKGQRYSIPILGGKVFAGPGIDGLSGVVLPGGADRQLVMSDGLKTLDALYEMQMDDGSVLTVHNRVRIDETVTPEPYKLSVIDVTAPVGKFEWMNRRVFVGTLETAKPDRDAVVIRGWGLKE